MKQKPASRRKSIRTTLGIHPSKLELVPGPLPYLRWECAEYVATVADRDVGKLGGMCSEILARLRLEKL